ncbi:hypothetical protein A3G68_06945 [Candidatus Gottesmanbacteria bacterium RIFCSPLOWO2_12_FULL_42_10]|nr:MAG: hypothetical protein A3G68_06945 [Candidatus Gottesmanbacteria bacterium RIFCSPLOWO2_12_FULL_42_10]
MKADSNLEQDIRELKVIVSDKLHRLTQFQKDFSRFKGYLSTEEKKLTSEKTHKLIEKFADFLKRSPRDRNALRLLVADFASLMIASDWQSPSYDFSLYSQAGRQTGKITGTVNDYKRDVHLDERAYEKEYIRQYIDARFKFRLSAFLVASGQAAFQTILTYLQSEGKLNGNVLCGQASYFQYKQILQGIFRNKLIEVAEDDTARILASIKKTKPKAVFLDSLCNSSQIAVPDIAAIMKFIYRECREEIYFIIDNTCLSVYCQPFNWRTNNRNVHLLTFESLNKYHQYGLDRVTGGIIVCEERDAAGIYEYRKHAGTNMTDFSLFCLPSPDRKLLENRLKRHQRNACVLAEFLDSGKVQVIYPGLPQHPGYPIMKNRGFFGSFLNLSFKNNHPIYFKKIISRTIDIAKKEKVNLAAGTSFGLNTTRIYLTSLWTKYGQPFLRISAGTETEENLGKLKRVFKKALD